MEKNLILKFTMRKGRVKEEWMIHLACLILKLLEEPRVMETRGNIKEKGQLTFSNGIEQL